MFNKGIYSNKLGIVNTENIVNPYTPNGTDYVGVLKNPGNQIATSSEYVYSTSYVPTEILGSNLDYPVPVVYKETGAVGALGYPVYDGDGLQPTWSRFIPAGTFSNGDIVEVEAYFYSNSTTNKTYKYRIYYNTVASIPTDTGTNILTTYGQGVAATKNVILRRSFAVRNAVSETVLCPQTTISFATDLAQTPTTTVTGTANLSSIKSINWNIDQYLIFAIEPGPTYDGSYAQLVSYKIVKY